MTDRDAAPATAPEFTVSEISGAVKRAIEGEFGLVRVRGEIGGCRGPPRGISIFDLKDDGAVLAGVMLEGAGGAAALQARGGARGRRDRPAHDLPRAGPSTR